jgi:hypothetical protein
MTGEDMTNPTATPSPDDEPSSILLPQERHPEGAEVEASLKNPQPTASNRTSRQSFCGRTKRWWARQSFSAEWVVSTLILGIVGFAYSNFQSNIEDERKEQSQAIAQKAGTLEKLRVDREELQSILGTMAGERNQLFMAKLIGDYIGYKGDLDQSYLLFTSRSISDLQIQRAISLTSDIEANYKAYLSIPLVPVEESNSAQTSGDKNESELEEKREQEPENPFFARPHDTEMFSDYFTIGLLLAQNGHLKGAKYYIETKCLSAIKRLLQADRLTQPDASTRQESATVGTSVVSENVTATATPTTQLTVAERELYEAIQLEGLTLLAIVHAIEKSTDDGALCKFATPINTLLNYDWPSIQKDLISASLAAIKALVAQSLFDRSSLKEGSGQSFDKQTDAEVALADLVKEVENLKKYPDSQFTNFVTIEKDFAYLAASHLHFLKAKRLMRLAKHYKALRAIEACKVYMNERTPDLLRKQADTLHLQLLLHDLEHQQRMLINTSIFDNHLVDLRHNDLVDPRLKLVVQLEKTDSLSSETIELKKVVVESSVVLINKLFTDIGTPKSSNARNPELRKIDTILGQLRRIDFSFSNPDVDMESLDGKYESYKNPNKRTTKQ